MRTVPPPSIPADYAYNACVDGIGDAARKSRFTAAAHAIPAADDRYRIGAARGACDGLDQEDFLLPGISKEDTYWLYENRLREGAKGRLIYSHLLKKTTPHRLCALCGKREAETLDHHLPQAQYHALVVNPANLVPACNKCNNKKSDGAKGTLNPYFDDLGDEKWLYAKVLKETPPVVEFFVCPPDRWSSRFAQRMLDHFDFFELGEAYKEATVRVLALRRRTLSREHANHGVSGVRQYLMDEANDQRADHPNSWETALFDALAESDWYCDGGFYF